MAGLAAGIEVARDKRRTPVRRHTVVEVVVASTCVSIVGTLVLWGLRAALFGLLDEPGLLRACAIGAFVSTLVLYPWDRGTRFSLTAVAIGIVASTFWRIASVFPPDNRVAVWFWATTVTGWWLVPGAMLVLAGARQLWKTWFRIAPLGAGRSGE